MMSGMQQEAAEKIDASLRKALAGPRHNQQNRQLPIPTVESSVPAIPAYGSRCPCG